MSNQSSTQSKAQAALSIILEFLGVSERDVNFLDPLSRVNVKAWLVSHDHNKHKRL
jgi:hypothetical protein